LVIGFWFLVPHQDTEVRTRKRGRESFYPQISQISQISDFKEHRVHTTDEVSEFQSFRVSEFQSPAARTAKALARKFFYPQISQISQISNFKDQRVHARTVERFAGYSVRRFFGFSANRESNKPRH